MPFHKTPAAAKLLNTPVSRLYSLMRYGKLRAPEKDTSGDFVWTEADLERARQAMSAGRRRMGVPT